MKTIAVAGLRSHRNTGEHILFKTTEWLITSQAQVDIRHIDFQSKKVRLIPAAMQKIRRIAARVLRVRRAWSKSTSAVHGSANNGVPKANPQKQFERYRQLHYRPFMRDLKDCDGLVFACGSFKYGTQLLWCSYSVLIECCESRGIPVMFNGVNVQAYDPANFACQTLKEHANSKAVKVFTTRDGRPGVMRLRENYITNPDILLQDVGDPGFWIPEAYGVTRQKGNPVIGVNLLRSTQFQRYGVDVTPERVVQAYADLLRLLDGAGLKWELFTNGMDEDLDGLDRIRAAYGGEGDFHVAIPRDDLDFVRRVSKYEAIVGARLHACICAYALDIPMVGFIWDEKMACFAKVTGNEDRLCKPEDFSGKALYSTLQSTMIKPYDTALRQRLREATRNSIRVFLNGDIDHP